MKNRANLTASEQVITIRTRTSKGPNTLTVEVNNDPTRDPVQIKNNLGDYVYMSRKKAEWLISNLAIMLKESE